LMPPALHHAHSCNDQALNGCHQKCN